ncbi:hypothetical protein TURU_053446 [Turdus rufiventris]|nr:hypothetical protein TURU_053446 [Turdus rufiventris]
MRKSIKSSKFDYMGELALCKKEYKTNIFRKECVGEKTEKIRHSGSGITRSDLHVRQKNEMQRLRSLNSGTCANCSQLEASTGTRTQKHQNLLIFSKIITTGGMEVNHEGPGVC